MTDQQQVDQEQHGSRRVPRHAAVPIDYTAALAALQDQIDDLTATVTALHERLDHLEQGPGAVGPDGAIGPAVTTPARRDGR